MIKLLKLGWWLTRLIFAALFVLMILGTIYQAKENFKRNGTLTYLR